MAEAGILQELEWVVGGDSRRVTFNRWPGVDATSENSDRTGDGRRNANLALALALVAFTKGVVLCMIIIIAGP